MRALLDLALVGLTAATACGGKRAGAGGRGLAYYESYDPRSLDPALSTDVPTGEMVTLAFDGLTQFDADGRLLPALADRWTAGQEGSGRPCPVHPRPGGKTSDRAAHHPSAPRARARGPPPRCRGCRCARWVAPPRRPRGGRPGGGGAVGAGKHTGAGGRGRGPPS